MSSTAAGQMLGFTLQFARALNFLLRGEIESAVGIEVLGDVSYFADNPSACDIPALIEEDKSSLNANPLGDSSENLWKTFFNWINTISENHLDPEQTAFYLYSTYPGRKSLVNEFSNVKSYSEGQLALANAQAKLCDLDPKSAVYRYCSFVVQDKADIFAKMLLRFKLIATKDSAISPIVKELQRMLIPKACCDELVTHMLGWVTSQFIELVRNKKPCILLRRDLADYITPLLKRIRQGELIDFVSHFQLLPKNLDDELAKHPTYIHQLELIQLEDQEIFEAINEYLTATINRTMWIDCELLDESNASDFENRLIDKWKIFKRLIKLESAQIKDEHFGQNLYYKCKVSDAMIANQVAPAKTVGGTYHTLADAKILGWHPNWEAALVDREVPV